MHTTDILYLLLTFSASLMVTFVAMPWLLRLCRVRGLYDMPNERKVHQNKIPRLGGLLFAPAMVVGMAVSYLLMTMLEPTTELPVFRLSTMILMAGLFLIYLIGILDDLLGLKASFKFLVQFAATLFMPLCGLYIDNFYGFCGLYEIPLWASYPLTVFVCLLIVNSINLIDGIDGLSSALSMIMLGVFAFVFAQLGVLSYTLLAVGLIGAVLAFFYFNMFGSVERGTKTFMGDTGSLVLGYAIAYLAIKYAINNPAVLPYRPHALLFSFTLVLVPCFDLVRVAVGRLWRESGIFSPDKSHLHHLCLAAGFSMRHSLLLIVGLQVALNVLNWFFYTHLQLSALSIVISDILCFAFFIFWLKWKAKLSSASS